MFFACLGAAMSLSIPLIVRYITGTVVYLGPERGPAIILRLTLLMIGMVLVECYCNYYIGYAGHMMGARMEVDMRNELYGHYQKLSFTYFDNEKVGQLMSRVTADLFDITELYHHGPENLAISVIKFTGAFIILLWLNWRLALAAFVMMPFVVAYALFMNRRMRNASKENKKRLAGINAQMEDSLSGIRVVKSFANEEVEMEKFREGNRSFLESKDRTYRYMGSYHSVMKALLTLVTVTVVGVAGVLLTRGQLEAADLVIFILYINNFTEPVNRLVDFTEQFQNGASGFERFLEAMAVEPDIQDKPDAIELGDVKGQVVFDHVSFHYSDMSENVLCNVNLTIEPGEYVALAGPSGVGKTTMCSLIPRFYEVNEGAIRIDGTDIRDVKLKSLRQHIGIVQQDVYLFAGTVAENIGYGRPGASMEDIVRAAQSANAHEFIMELPDGYETDIGQRGVKLSGGQKQRISLARVFLKDPAILIFDEATSALDNESERIVQASLEKLAKGRTTFVIAHRLSTIRNAKRILVLTENGIEEEGNHQELLEKGGAYSRLYQAQYVG